MNGSLKILDLDYVKNDVEWCREYLEGNRVDAGLVASVLKYLFANGAVVSLDDEGKELGEHDEDVLVSLLWALDRGNAHKNDVIWIVDEFEAAIKEIE